jgi:prepilin-type N-terminal cleavage/methylation domain-containing protein
MTIWKKRKIGGFSLVELMVVVAIIGILASLALPRFRTFQAKARQTEAKNNLMNIYSLQEAYFADKGEYFNGLDVKPCPDGNATGGNPLGFVLNPCKTARYTYTTTGSKTEWTATATAPSETILPGCNGKSDVWTIDMNKNLDAKTDVTKEC